MTDATRLHRIEPGTSVDLSAIDLSQDRGFGQSGANAGGHVVRRDGLIKLFSAAIRQDYGKHGRLKTFDAMELRPTRHFG